MANRMFCGDRKSKTLKGGMVSQRGKGYGQQNVSRHMEGNILGRTW